MLTTTVGTLRDLSIIRETGVLKTSQVLLDRRGPALAQSRPLRLVAEVEADHVLAVELALEVDQAHAVANRFLLSCSVMCQYMYVFQNDVKTYHSDEVNLKVFLTHLLLDIHKSGLGNRLGVNFEALLSLTKPGRKPRE